VQTLFTALHANGYVVERSQLSAIDPTTGRGLPDRYVEGTCPICGYDGARGDQCDNCGNQLDPQDLKDPRSKIDGKPPKFVESAQFFLELPAFAEALGGWLQTRQGWRPERPEVQREPDRRPQAAGRSPATSTGACRSRCRSGAAGRQAASTCGSTR
jgi:methionyl-tRNA synthetase